MSTALVVIVAAALAGDLGLGAAVLLGRRRRAASAWLRTCAPVEDALASPFAPPVSVLAASTRTEELAAYASSLQALRYPDDEVVLVDASADGAGVEALRQRFRLVPAARALRHTPPHPSALAAYRSREHPRLVVLRAGAVGTAAALDLALAASHHADVLVAATPALDEEALVRAAAPRLVDPHAARGVVALAGGSGRLAATALLLRLALPRRLRLRLGARPALLFCPRTLLEAAGGFAPRAGDPVAGLARRIAAGPGEPRLELLPERLSSAGPA